MRTIKSENKHSSQIFMRFFPSERKHGSHQQTSFLIKPKTEVSLNRKKIVLILTVFTALLVFLSTIGQIYKHSYGDDRYLVSLFHLDTEHNLPTWYSSLLLLLSSVLLLIIGTFRKTSKETDANHWLILSAIFFMMSTDEILILHEQLSSPIRSILHIDGLLHFAWVIPFAILLLILGLSYISFMRNLPHKIRVQFFLAGFLYVNGALGMEILSGGLRESKGENSLIYSLLTTFEETLEMAGMVVFINALLAYFQKYLRKFRISVK